MKDYITLTLVVQEFWTSAVSVESRSGKQFDTLVYK